MNDYNDDDDTEKNSTFHTNKNDDYDADDNNEIKQNKYDHVINDND